MAFKKQLLELRVGQKITHTSKSSELFTKDKGYFITSFDHDVAKMESIAYVLDDDGNNHELTCKYLKANFKIHLKL